MNRAEDIIKELLKQRNIFSDEETAEFLSERPQRTYDPFLLLNMEAGVDLLLSEIEAGTKICIYGDYDVDGVMSVCILVSLIRELTDNYIYYIPSRFSEGYGLNNDAIAKLHKQGVGLIVTVDCGSVSYSEVEYAKSIGIKVIVTDHHSIEDVKADCVLINPKQQGCTYPFKELAGCGVAFKLAQAVRKKTGLPKQVTNDMLDLLAIGTIGDVVSLTDENRTMVKYGIDMIRAGRRSSLRCLVERICSEYVTSEDIAFSIAPHINAAGRIAHAEEAVRLFTSDDEKTMDKQAYKLIEYNRERKTLQEEAYLNCMEKNSVEDDFIILNMGDMHEGIAGIVAGRIKEACYRPVIILTDSDESFLKGTGRSIPGINIYAMLKKHDNIFEKFGGHKGACGFLMKKEKLDTFIALMKSEIECIKSRRPDLFEVIEDYDIEIDKTDISVELVKALQSLEPFGQDNRNPVFKVKSIMPESAVFMGNGRKHIRFRINAGKRERIDCVMFHCGEDSKNLVFSGKPLTAIGTLSMNVWKGYESIRFIIEELKA